MTSNKFTVVKYDRRDDVDQPRVAEICHEFTLIANNLTVIKLRFMFVTIFEAVNVRYVYSVDGDDFHSVSNVVDNYIFRNISGQPDTLQLFRNIHAAYVAMVNPVKYIRSWRRFTWLTGFNCRTTTVALRDSWITVGLFEITRQETSFAQVTIVKHGGVLSYGSSVTAYEVLTAVVDALLRLRFVDHFCIVDQRTVGERFPYSDDEYALSVDGSPYVRVAEDIYVYAGVVVNCNKFTDKLLTNYCCLVTNTLMVRRDVLEQLCSERG